MTFSKNVVYTSTLLITGICFSYIMYTNENYRVQCKRNDEGGTYLDAKHKGSSNFMPSSNILRDYNDHLPRVKRQEGNLYTLKYLLKGYELLLRK